MATPSASTPAARQTPATPAIHAWRSNQSLCSFISTRTRQRLVAPTMPIASDGEGGGEGGSRKKGAGASLVMGILGGEEGGEAGGVILPSELAVLLLLLLLLLLLRLLL